MMMWQVEISLSTIRPALLTHRERNDRLWQRDTFRQKLDSGPRIVQLDQTITMDEEIDPDELPRKITVTFLMQDLIKVLSLHSMHAYL